MSKRKLNTRKHLHAARRRAAAARKDLASEGSSYRAPRDPGMDKMTKGVEDERFEQLAAAATRTR